MKSRIIKRSISIAGRKTAVSLEDDFWNALKKIADERETSLSDLIARIKADRRIGNLSSALRLFVLSHFQDQIPAHLSFPQQARLSAGRGSGAKRAFRR